MLHLFVCTRLRNTWYHSETLFRTWTIRLSCFKPIAFAPNTAKVSCISASLCWTQLWPCMRLVNSSKLYPGARRKL